MLFENLHVGRIAVHEVFQRGADRALVPPTFSDRLEELDEEAIGAFRLRMTDALSSQSQCLQMRLVKYGADSLVATAGDLLHASDEEFLSGSQRFASRLAEAQMSRQIPGGVVIVFEGSVGSPASPFIGVIKAETQAGFRRSLSADHAIVEFLQNIFLTPATRLYKIGIFIRTDETTAPPDGWRVFVFDSNISLTSRESAASYFYDAFLGCSLPSDGKYETARFFDLTKDFIRRSILLLRVSGTSWTVSLSSYGMNRNQPLLQTNFESGTYRAICMILT